MKEKFATISFKVFHITNFTILQSIVRLDQRIFENLCIQLPLNCYYLSRLQLDASLDSVGDCYGGGRKGEGWGGNHPTENKVFYLLHTRSPPMPGVGIETKSCVQFTKRL